MTDVTKNSRLFAVTSTTCSTLLLAVCVHIVFSTHRHPASTSPAHPVSVPIRHPSDKSSVVTSSETYIYIYILRILRRIYIANIPGTYAVYSCVWRLGCFPGAWRRSSWHFQVAITTISWTFVRFTPGH